MNRYGFRAVMVAALLLALITFSLQAQDVSNLKYPKLSKLELPDVEKVTLDNGIRLYLVEDHSLPTFRASVRINYCGGYLESTDKIGLADLCGQVMRTGGAGQWSGDEIDELLEGVGGSVETWISTTSGGVSVRVLAEHTDLGLEVLSQVLRHPRFDEDKLDLAKVQGRSAIARRNDEPFPILIREFRKVIYGAESPYARHTEYATINAVSRDDLIAFHKTYVQPENLQMAICGDFSRSEIVAKVRQYFGDWSRGGVEVASPPKVEYAFDSKLYFASKPDAPQACILMGHIGGYLADEDWPARTVMNSILGGGFGSRLVNNVRSKEGLAYTTQGAYTSGIERPGIFYLLASTKPETMAKALKEMIKQTKSMQTDPPTDVEMRKGKDGYLNSFVFKFDSKGEVVNRLMEYDFYGLPEDLLFQQKEGVEKVTKDDVVAAAVNNLQPDKLRILVLGNADEFDVPLAELGMGPVEEIDITIPSGEEKKELVVTPENLAKGKEILDKAVAAAGGIDNFKTIKSVSLKGTMLVTSPMGEMSMSIESVEILPDKSRTTMTVMGQKIYNVRNGDIGWNSNPMTGEIIEKNAAGLEEENKELRRNLLLIYQQCDNPTYQAVYDGAGEVEGKAVEYVALLDSAGESICRLGFGVDDYLIVSKSYWGASPLGEGNVEERYADFQETAGVRMPTSRIIYMDGQKVVQVGLSEYLLNADIPADAFTKPEL